MSKILFALLAVGIFICPLSYSQSITPVILNSAGGSAVFPFYQFEWNFGEATSIITMYNGNSANLVVTTGVLEPGTNAPGRNDNGNLWTTQEIKILPNPTSNLLEIDFFSKQKGKITMNLFTETGELLGSRQFDYYGTGRIEYWRFDPYPVGNYFINIELSPFPSSLYKKGAYKIQKVNP